MTMHGSEEPDEIIKKLIPLLPDKGTVLDIGCGRGRNTLPLARCGLHVEAWDNSESDIGALREQAAREGLKVNPVHIDMRSLYIGFNRWDAILTIMCLHFLRPEEARERLNRIRTNLRPGGYHGFKIFTSHGMQGVRDDRFYPPIKELFESYSLWDIAYKETGSENKYLALLARKPV